MGGTFDADIKFGWMKKFGKNSHFFGGKKKKEKRERNDHD